MKDIINSAEENFVKAVAIKRYVKLDKFKDTYKSLTVKNQREINIAVGNNNLDVVVSMMDSTLILKHMNILDLFDIADTLGIKNIRKKPKDKIVKIIEARREG